MSIPVPVTKSVDLSMIGLPTAHNYYGAATGYMSPSLGLAMEAISLPMFWPPGVFTNKSKLTLSVMSGNCRVVQGGHNLGMMVPHLEIIPAPDDLLTPLQMLKSSFEVKFKNGEVLVDGSPIGSLLPPPFAPALVCTDLVSMPIGYSITNMLSSVIHYMSIVDLIAGWAEIAVTMFYDLIATLAGKSFGGQFSWTSEVAGALFGSPEGNLLAAGSATSSSLAGAFVRSIGREYFGYRGPISVSTQAGIGMMGSGQLEFTSNDDGSWSVAATETGPYGVAGLTQQYGQDAAGNETFTAAGNAAGFSEQNTVTRQQTPDGSSQTTQSHQSQSQWTAQNWEPEYNNLSNRQGGSEVSDLGGPMQAPTNDWL